MRKILFTIYTLATSAFSFANPSIAISMDTKTSDGEEQKGATSVEGSAPITATLYFSVMDQEDYQMYYEWRFCHEKGSLEEPYMIRYEESPEVVFSEAGMDKIALYAYFVNPAINDTVFFTKDYWNGKDGIPLTVKPSESELVMPNAFSPNGDQINDFYHPKSHKSIVEFHAAIYNRWGQKLYEWNDVEADGWDGTYNGKDVKAGTYFVVVKAKGADGTVFDIKRDVNILRGIIEDDGAGSTMQ